MLRERVQSFMSSRHLLLHLLLHLLRLLELPLYLLLEKERRPGRLCTAQQQPLLPNRNQEEEVATAEAAALEEGEKEGRTQCTRVLLRGEKKGR